MADLPYDPETIQKLLDAGWIAPNGEGYTLTVAGQQAIRKGRPGKVYGATLPIDSIRARLPPNHKKKKHRKP
jgi:hypothetical protein